LIRQLTKGLQEVQAVHYQPYRKNLGQFSAEEFDALLTASEEVTYGDYWMLEPLVTKEMIDYKTYCLELDDRLGSKKYYEDYAVLRLGVTILNDGKGNNTLSLVFSPDFFWPT